MISTKITDSVSTECFTQASPQVSDDVTVEEFARSALWSLTKPLIKVGSQSLTRTLPKSMMQPLPRLDASDLPQSPQSHTRVLTILASR